MGPEFFQTGMGHTFYQSTMPNLVKAIENQAQETKKTNELLEKVLDSKALEEQKEEMRKTNELLANVADAIRLQTQAVNDMTERLCDAMNYLR